MFGSRTLLLALVLALTTLAPMAVAPPGAAADMPDPVYIEPALAELIESGALTPIGYGADNDQLMSLIVRLDGPSLVERRQAELVAEAATGALPMSRAELQAAHDALAVAQAPAERAVAATGARVIDRYQSVLNGFLVLATRSQIPELARVPGVVSVARAPVLELDLKDSVDHIGATRTREELGIDGTGATIAILDTGVDYTHAAFGGPGTQEIYLANDPAVVEEGTFPTARVVGGYDFAGELFSADSACQFSQFCSNTPNPDDDPLDENATEPHGVGHGTHVAGIAAGGDTGKVHAGVAPGANIVALKLFGTPVDATGAPIPASSNLAPSAVEWVVENNMGLSVPGTGGLELIGKIDVINMSLGAPWAPSYIEADRVAEAARAEGVTVVASAGNNENVAYITGAPAASDKTLSVASSYAPNDELLAVRATWSDGGQDYELLEDATKDGNIDLPDSAWAAVITETLSAPLAWYGLACTGIDGEPAQDMAGKIALVQRGSCTFSEKAANAEAAGAVGAVLFTTPDRLKGGMAQSAGFPVPTIPLRMIDSEPGETLRELVERGVVVTMAIEVDKQPFPTKSDTMSEFSSRGPSRPTGGIKPQITAPGSNIFAAGAGTGDDGQLLFGTSMSGPHVAGVAALLWQRNKDEGLGLDAVEIAALAMNYADPVLKLRRNDTGQAAPVTRQGAGLANAYRSAKGMTVVRSDEGIAELGFGVVGVFDDPMTVRRQLTVKNLADTAKTYELATAFARPDEDGDKGATLTFAPEELTLDGGASGTVDVTLTLDPDALRAWELRGQDVVAYANHTEFSRHEIDGWVRLTEVDDAGAAVIDGDVVGVPFHVLPRRRSCVASQTADPFTVQVGGTFSHELANFCVEEGPVEAYALVGEDTSEADYPGRVNIEHVGVRWGPADQANPDLGQVIEWRITTAGPRRVPIETEARVWLDVNRDGLFDTVVVALQGGVLGLPNGTMVSAVVPILDSVRLTLPAANSGQWAVQYLLPYDLEDSTLVIAASADSLRVGDGLDNGEMAMDFFVSMADTVERELPGTSFVGYDLAPDNAFEQNRGVFTIDQSLASCVLPEDATAFPLPYGSVPVAGHGELALQMGGGSHCQLEGDAQEAAVGLLLAYPENVAGEASEIRRGTVRGGTQILLPHLSNEVELRPEPEPEPLSIAVPLDEVDESGIEGVAYLDDTPDGLFVALELSGTTEDAEHPAHIHGGTCAELGDVTHELSPVDGTTGLSETLIEDLTVLDVANDDHAIAVHFSADDPTVLACGYLTVPE